MDVCFMFFYSAGTEPLRRAAARAAVSLRHACEASSVVVKALGTSCCAFVPASAFVGRGVAAVGIPTALGLLALASLIDAGTKAHEHENVLRGPAWGCPPPSLSADAACVLCTALFPACAESGSFFASVSMAALASRPHFYRYGLGAAKDVVGALEELEAGGVVLNSKCWGSLFPVASLRDSVPSMEEVELAWTPTSWKQQQAAHALASVVNIFAESTCLYRRLCSLFWGGGREGACPGTVPVLRVPQGASSPLKNAFFSMLSYSHCLVKLLPGPSRPAPPFPRRPTTHTGRRRQ